MGVPGGVRAVLDYAEEEIERKASEREPPGKRQVMYKKRKVGDAEREKAFSV